MLIRATISGESPYFVPQLQIQLRMPGVHSTEDGRADQ